MVLVYFLLFILLFTLLIKGGLVLMGHRAGQQVAVRHQEAEYIIETGQVPVHWADDEEKLVRLDTLAEYFRTSAMVADEPTREMILNELARVRRQWDIENK